MFASNEKVAATKITSIKLARAAKGEKMNNTKNANIKIVSSVLFVFFALM
jgi:hypothetical protein